MSRQRGHGSRGVNPYFADRAQGAGAIAAAAPPPRSAPAAMIRRGRIALGADSVPLPCSFYVDGVWYARRANGQVEKVSREEAASMQSCPAPTSSGSIVRTPTSTSRLASASPRLAGMTTKTSTSKIDTAPTRTGTLLQPAGTMTTPGIVVGPAPTTTPAPTRPSPAPTPTPTLPTAPAPTTSTSPAPTPSRGRAAYQPPSASTTVVFSPTISSPAPAPAPAAPAPAVDELQFDTTDTQRPTSQAPSRTPWLAIGMFALAAVVLLKK